ncbi:MAG: FG-GAP-like repeat-containing protein [Verrucomicrobia bacterium]|nr:FG-GAP-like repeat-containing protein [Verrucomicrobiota bacterium]
MGDYDNDGWLDLFVGNFQDPGFPNFPGGHALFRNNHDGTFFRVTTGSPANEGGRACGTTWGDYDNDGFLDLYVACGDGFAEPNLLYRNNGNSNHWLKVSLRGTASNRMGIGAKVRVLTTIGGEPLWQTRTISGQHSWISEDGLLAHFGLGDATVAEVVRVEWPSGTVQELKDQSVDRLLTVTEVARIQPARPSASVAGSVTLSTAGTDPYQWRFNGVELPGETKRILALTNLTAAQGGRYSVLVTAADGVITTNFAYLRIDPTFAKVTTGAVANDIEPSQSGTWCDYDADGWPDLFVANYTSGFNTPNSLYHNQRDGSFLRVANRITEGPGHATAGVWADYDNDGDPDLFVARLGGTNQMFCNQGPAGFVRMPTAPTKGPGLEGAWADIDGDGWLDLLVTTTSQTLLYHSLGNGEFRFLTAAQAGTVVQTGDASVSPAFCDFDHDGDPDLYVTADNARSHLYRNLGAGKFGSVVLGAVPPATARVTAVWADYDNDGFFDLFTTSRGNMHTLHRNLNGQEFVDVTVTAGLSLSMPQMVFGAAWGDYDNDADLDLFVPGYSSSSVLYRNDGNGTFTSVDVGSPIVDGATDESASWVDYDGDGLLDLFVACGEGTPAKNLLYRNQLGTLGNANHWLKVRLQGTVSNRDGIGARVRVRATVAGRPVWQVRQISSNGAWAGGTELVAHWGLGNAATAGEVRIEWPSGIVQELRNVPANQILTVTEPPALEALGEGRIRLLCWARQSHEVEVSDDLQTWHSLGVVATDQHRPVILDPGAAGKPHRFYRAKGL